VREIHVWCPHSDVFDTNAAQALVYASAQPINGPTEFSATVDQLMPAIIPVDRRVRYIRIFPTSTTTGSLPLAEVQVFAYQRGSVGAHAVSAVGNATELQAIDFNRSTVFGDSVARAQPYWDLDLGGHRYLETIKLWTQGDPSMATFHLFASDSDFVDASGKRITSLQTVQGTPGVSHWIGRGTSTVTAISVMRQARFVRVQLDGTAAIKFSDVEIATTEGFAIGELPDESELRINASVINRPYNSYDIQPVFDIDRTWVVNGHFPRANTRINAYAFTPNSNGNGGTYALFASTTSGATPELTGYGAAPQYPFSFPSFVFPGGWLVGSVGTVMYSADDNDGFTPTPIRGIDASAFGSEHVYWPDTRIVSGIPTPDETLFASSGDLIPPSNAAYLARPAQDDTIANYPNNDLIPTTLSAFKTKYGPQLNTWIHATYYNAGDLGIGRDMYCRAPVGTPYRVCMVDNYARVNATTGKPIFGDPVGAGGAQAKKVATVVMVSVNGSSTGFGAYDANGNRLNGIALDSTGKHVKIPNNCLTCHSGMPTTFSNGQTYQGRAWFLPFDVSSFQDLGTHKLSDQAGAFTTLNLFVLTKAPSDMTALRELINGWYHNNPFDSEQPFDDSFVPPGWTKTPGDARFYTDVIKPYCRTCHVMQSSSTGALDFRNANDTSNLRAAILAYVCTIRQMPHAQQTLKRFWQSGARAQLLGYLGRNDLVAACGR